MAAKQFHSPLASSFLLLFPVRMSRAQRLSSTTVYPSRRRVAPNQTAAFLGGGATDTLLSRVGKAERNGLNRPWLSVPVLDLAPHRTGRAVFPHPALRGSFVVSLQGLVR